MNQINKIEIIREILEEMERDLEDKELMEEILKETFSKNTSASIKLSFGQKAADLVAGFVGSWKFIIIFVLFLIFWMITNIILATIAFDPYPFILLNLLLSTIAAIQAPLIMMSQNRLEQKDRERAENDYKVNLKTEILIEDLYKKLEKVLENQEVIIERIGNRTN